MNDISNKNRSILNQLRKLETQIRHIDTNSSQQVFDFMGKIFNQLDIQYREKEKDIYPFIYNLGSDDMCSITKRMDFERHWSKSFFCYFRSTWSSLKEVKENLPLYKTESLKFIKIVKLYFEHDESDIVQNKEFRKLIA